MPIHIDHRIPQTLRAIEGNISVARSNLQQLSRSNTIDVRLGNDLQGLLTITDQLREVVKQLVHDLKRSQ